MNKNRWLLLMALIGFLVGGVVIGMSALDGTAVFAQDGITVDSDDDGDNEDRDEDEMPITGQALEDASAAALEYIGEGKVTDTEVGDEEGFYEVEITRDDGSEVDVHLDESFNVIGHEDEDGDDEEDRDEDEMPITGQALEDASAAALEYIGEGKVTDTEVGDEEGFYEVEITRDDGSEVDVHLDESFNVIGHEDE